MDIHRLSSMSAIQNLLDKTSSVATLPGVKSTYGLDILTSRSSFLGRKGSGILTNLIKGPPIARDLVVLTLHIRMRSGVPFSLHGVSLPQLLTFNTNLPHRIVHRLLLDYATFSPKLEDLILAECHTALCPLGSPDLAALNIRLFRVQGPPICAALLSSTCCPAQVQFRWDRRGALRMEALRILCALNYSRITKLSLFFGSPEHRVLSILRFPGPGALASSLYEIELKEHLLPGENPANTPYPWTGSITWTTELRGFKVLRKLRLGLPTARLCPPQPDVVQNWLGVRNSSSGALRYVEVMVDITPDGEERELTVFRVEPNYNPSNLQLYKNKRTGRHSVTEYPGRGPVIVVVLATTMGLYAVSHAFGSFEVDQQTKTLRLVDDGNCTDYSEFSLIHADRQSVINSRSSASSEPDRPTSLELVLVPAKDKSLGQNQTSSSVIRSKKRTSSSRKGPYERSGPAIVDLGSITEARPLSMTPKALKNYFWSQTGDFAIDSPPELAKNPYHNPAPGDVFVHFVKRSQARQVWLYALTPEDKTKGYWKALSADAGAQSNAEDLVAHPSFSDRVLKFPLNDVPSWTTRQTVSRNDRARRAAQLENLIG